MSIFTRGSKNRGATEKNKPKTRRRVCKGTSPAEEVVPPEEDEDNFHFLVIGDAGEPNKKVELVAKSMSFFAEKLLPKFVIALGDNIYENGASSVNDSKFRTHWADMFLVHPALRIPWKMCLGLVQFF
jgi:tartrate-resistant acid phosphatase type 5